MDAVSRLDHAIVVAGAPGKGRIDLILGTIERIQQIYLPLQPSELATNFRKTPSPLSESSLLPSSSRPIPSLVKVPSLSAFQSRYSTLPFILRKFALDWPALTDVRDWSSKEYLLRVAGRGRVVPVEVGRDYRDNNWTNVMMGWEAYLGSLFASGGASSNNITYLAQHDLFKQFPLLRSDIMVPDYVYATLSPPGHFPQYRPPNNEESLVVNAWLGPKGTVSPAHTVSDRLC